MVKFLALALSVILVCVDQASKKWTLDILASSQRMPVINDLFYLTYVENRGAAFGIFQGKLLFLSIFSAAIMLGILYVMLSGRVKSPLLIWSLSLILAGGVGNLIDRALRGFVVDFLDFSALFNFPVFNFADCYVVVGTFAMFFYLIRSDYTQSKNKKIIGDTAGEKEA